MRKVIICLVLTIATGIIIFPHNAQAALFWDWNFTNNFQTVGPTDSIVAKGRITNLAGSDSNLTFQNFGTATYSNGPTAQYSFEWALAGNFFEQFFALNLAPGESFDFVFGTLTPYGGTPVGFYYFFGGLELADTESGEIFRKFNFKVTGPSHVIPEPSTFFLLGSILFGFALRKKHISIR